MSTKSLNSGDTGYTGDRSDYIMENTVKENNNHSNSISKKCNCPQPTDSRIVHNHPFYFCIEHPKFENINLEVIATAYNLQNQTIGTENAFTDPNSIEPGQSAPFKMTLGSFDNIPVDQIDHIKLHIDWRDSNHTP